MSDLLNQFKELTRDTDRDNFPNITFFGFLLGNYSKAALRTSLPDLCEYIGLDLTDEED